MGTANVIRVAWESQLPTTKIPTTRPWSLKVEVFDGKTGGIVLVLLDLLRLNLNTL